ncbi:MAG TPA: hypothetical protein VGH81_00345 [Rudaea sp.]
MRNLPIAVLLLIALLGSAAASAQTPQGTAFTYQGVLKQNGNAINGNTDMVFDLFDAAVGGNLVGPSLSFTSGNGNPVNVVNSVFDVTLDFGPTAFMTLITDQRFLRITVNGTALAPRTQIQSEPYALQSQTAELAYSVSNASIGTAQIIAAQVQRRVSGTCTSGSAISTVNQDGTVGCQNTGQGTITGVTAGNGLSGGGSSGGIQLSADTTVLQKRITSSCAAGSTISAIAGDGTVTCQQDNIGTITQIIAGIGLTGGGNNGVVPLAVANPLTLSNSSGSNTIQGTSTSASGFGVAGNNTASGGVGVGGTGEVGVNGSGTVYGVKGFGTNAGVIGVSSLAAGAGVYGSNSASGGVGIHGDAAGSSTGVYGTATYGNGVSGFASGAGGSGGNGVYGASLAVAGAGVSGLNNGGDGVYGSGNVGVYGTGTTYGIYATGPTALYANVPAATTNGFGVYAYSHATSGPGNGIYGQSDSSGGVGVSGYSGSGIGVAGSTSSGLAGKFIGNVNVTGTLSKGAGSFKIDHPLDPANKYLYHSFVESPDMKNIYDGVAMLDASGSAWVTLPTYFEALNQDFRYQITALGRPAPSLYVADEIAGNRFRIAGGAPGQRVSWQVTGTRHDAFANANRIPIEVEKTDAERGKYLYPAAFGKPAAMAVDRELAQPKEPGTAPPSPTATESSVPR